MIITKQKSAGGSTRIFYGAPSLGMVMASFSNDNLGLIALSIFERGIDATEYVIVDADAERAPLTDEERAAGGEFPIA